MTKAMTKTQTMAIIKEDLESIERIDKALSEIQDVLSDNARDSLISDISEISEHLTWILTKVNNEGLSEKTSDNYFEDDDEMEFTIGGYHTNSYYDTCIVSRHLIYELEAHDVLTESDSVIYAY
jgi:hypothetical protein